MVRPGTSVVSAKLDAVTPLAKVVLASATVSVAPSKFDSASAAGLVAATAADGVTNRDRERQGWRGRWRACCRRRPQP